MAGPTAASAALPATVPPAPASADQPLRRYPVTRKPRSIRFAALARAPLAKLYAVNGPVQGFPGETACILGRGRPGQAPARYGRIPFG
jgi:hypothetical protein